jgi:UDP-glucuronate 4-epimerase
VGTNGWRGDARWRAQERHAGEVQLCDDDSIVAVAPEPSAKDDDEARAADEGDGGDLKPGRRYLVTGCAGFIGSHLTQALAARGCSVVGVDAFTDNYSRSIKQRNLEQCLEEGDVRFAELDLAGAPVEPLLDGVDGVFHLAARPGVRTSWGLTFDGYLRDNMSATQRVFEAAVGRGIRVVYASSSSVYGDAEAYPLREDAKPMPVSPYGVSKLACESLAGAYASSLGLDAVGMRFFSVYGPRQRPDMAFAAVFDCLARNHPFRLFGNGRQSRDFTFVGDVVEATLAAMQRAPSGRVYNVGGGSEISLLDAVTLCERIVGRRLELNHVGAGTGDARRTLADFGLAQAELGWTPATSLEAGLRAQAESTAAAAVEPPRAVAEAV